MKDQSDVGPLSCRVTFKPVSAPLQDDLRFFRPPKPAPPWAPLRFAVLPEGQARYGVSTFRSEKYAGLGACCRPGGHGPRERKHQRFSHLQHLLVQASQPLSLVYNYDLYRRFRYLHLTGYLALTRLWLPGGYASRDLYPAQTVLRYIVRAALYSGP